MSDMGTGEMGTPSKTTKTSTPQEQPPSTAPMSYPEWAAAFQAYYSTGTTPLPPPGYFPSAVGSGPQPHPYMWGAQPLMPPYGTPPPYAAMYPHGQIFTHPSMPPGTHPYSPYGLPSGNASEGQAAATSAGNDGEGKSTSGKTRSPMKRSKGSLGSLGMLTGKGSNPGKGNSRSMNGVFSQSADSGSEGSTEGSEGNSENGSEGVRKGSFDQATSEAPVANSTLYGGAQDANHTMGNHPVAAVPISIAGKQVVGAGPLTNLNIGMDYWSGGTPSVLANSRAKRGSGAVTTAMIPSTNMIGSVRDGVPPELWLQDERELKRQRRKQSNRESARRSRLRKQAECEDLQTKVEALSAENASLRSELNHLTEQCNKLSADNSSLRGQLQIRRTLPGGTEAESEKNDITLLKSEKRDVEGHESLGRDGREASESLTLTGTSNVEYECGNVVVSVSLS